MKKQVQNFRGYKVMTVPAPATTAPHTNAYPNS